MLPKRRKLTAHEVREILSKGRAARSGSLLVKYLKGSGSQAAVVVSKKVAKSAVERNRIRRQLYAALKRSLPSHTCAVFMVQKNTAELPQDVATLCSKLS